jgi:hypothetical protein
LQGGLFVASRLRIAGRLIAFLSEPEDEVEIYSSNEFKETATDSPSVLYGAALGFAVLSRPTFVMSPSVVFARTDVKDYGSFVGLGVPIEWVMEGGARLGFEIDLGRAFGGSTIERCQNLGVAQSCVPGEERRVDRSPGTALLLHSDRMGYGPRRTLAQHVHRSAVVTMK